MPVPIGIENEHLLHEQRFQPEMAHLMGEMFEPISNLILFGLRHAKPYGAECRRRRLAPQDLAAEQPDAAYEGIELARQLRVILPDEIERFLDIGSMPLQLAVVEYRPYLRWFTTDIELIIGAHARDIGRLPALGQDAGYIGRFSFARRCGPSSQRSQPVENEFRILGLDAGLQMMGEGVPIGMKKLVGRKCDDVTAI